MCVYSMGDENQDLGNNFTCDAVSEVSIGVFDAHLKVRGRYCGPSRQF